MNAIILSIMLMIFQPTNNEIYNRVIRDEIAMEYMEKIDFNGKHRFFKQIAKEAYKFADAMLEESKNLNK